MKTWHRLLLAAIAATALLGFAAASQGPSPDDDLSSGCPCRLPTCQCVREAPAP
jgi:hypothetical protein